MTYILIYGLPLHLSFIAPLQTMTTQTLILKSYLIVILTYFSYLFLLLIWQYIHSSLYFPRVHKHAYQTIYLFHVSFISIPLFFPFLSLKSTQYSLQLRRT